VLVVLLLGVVVDGTEDDVVLLGVVVADVEVVDTVDVVAVVEVVVEVVDATVVLVDGVVVVVGAVEVVVEEIVVVVVAGMEVVVVLPGTAPVQAENSEVSPSGAVAVAVITWPAAACGSGNVRLASPDPLVMTWMAPRNVAPSPLPLSSHEGLAKNSTVNEVSARLLSVPVTSDEDTIDSTG
jgi:hypothetical protein